MTVEVRFCELRAEGDRVLTGTAIRYGDIAVLPWGQERFERGAFDVSNADVILNAHHRRDVPLARTGGGGLELRDGDEALTIRAEIVETQAGTETLTLVEKKILRGLSLEFRARSETMAGGVRVIRRADVSAVSVVDRPAYTDSVVSAMRSKMAAAERPRMRAAWL